MCKYSPLLLTSVSMKTDISYPDWEMRVTACLARSDPNESNLVSWAAAFESQFGDAGFVQFPETGSYHLIVLS